MKSRKPTRKWSVPLSYALERSLTLSQALKWHPDRNKGSEEANQKFKEVCLHPFVDANYHNVRVFKLDIRSLRGSERRQQARCL
jgi:hypothetical protein